MTGAQKALMIVGEVISLIMVVIYGFLFFPAIIAAGYFSSENVGTMVLLYFFIITMVNVVLAIMGRRTKNKAILILNMITSIGSLIFLNGIGAEWGLRAVKRHKQLQKAKEE